MSFGFSVGDFLTAGKLISDIVTSLRAASIAEYRELICELHGLQRALHEIEHLKCISSQEAAVNGIKVAALMCQYPLDEFSAKLKKFERLGFNGGKTHSRLEIMKIWTRKLQWGFCMKEEVEKLRTYIVVHVGSLNMRLITQGLVSTSFAAEEAGRGRTVLEGRLDDAHKIISQTQHDLNVHSWVVQNNESMLKKLSSIITRDIVSQLKTLVDLASKIWDSNLQVIGFMTQIQASINRPDSRFTWVQEPVRFEDAVGRVIPVPSEYNCRKLEAIIGDQFRDGLGHQKVSAGEYELFNSFDSSKTVSLSEDQSLTPGMAITMAIVYGYYESGPLSHCPRPDCRSSKVKPNEAGGMSCLVCTAWFDLARNSLPRPLRPPGFDYQEFRGPTAEVRGTKRKRDVTDTGEQADMQQFHLKLRMERKRFKNVLVHFTKLPETPRLRNSTSPSLISYSPPDLSFPDSCPIPRRLRSKDFSPRTPISEDSLPSSSQRPLMPRTKYSPPDRSFLDPYWTPQSYPSQIGLMPISEDSSAGLVRTTVSSRKKRRFLADSLPRSHRSRRPLGPVSEFSPPGYKREKQDRMSQSSLRPVSEC